MRKESLSEYMTENQRSIASQLGSCVDPCQFRTVRRYCRDKRSEIRQVILVESNYRLEEVGAVITDGGVPQLSVLLALGAAKIGVDRLGLDDKHCVALQEVCDDSFCRVLYLPPAYVVQLDPSTDA